MTSKTALPVRALLLAAGLGTRLRPITDVIPKCLVEVGGQTLIGRWLVHLMHLGCNDVIINLHYKAQQVQSYLEKNAQSFSSINKTLAYEAELLGTAGTLLRHKNELKNSRVLMIHADNITNYDLKSLLFAHENRPNQCLMTMLLFKQILQKVVE